MTELEKKAKQYSSKYARQYYHNDKSGFTTSEEEVCKAYIAGAKENGTVWHNLKTNPEDLPKVDRLVRVRLMSGMEHICETCYYEPSKDEIGYGKRLFSFYELNGEWIDENEIIAWCELPRFNKELIK